MSAGVAIGLDRPPIPEAGNESSLEAVEPHLHYSDCTCDPVKILRPTSQCCNCNRMSLTQLHLQHICQLPVVKWRIKPSSLSIRQRCLTEQTRRCHSRPGRCHVRAQQQQQDARHATQHPSADASGIQGSSSARKLILILGGTGEQHLGSLLLRLQSCSPAMSGDLSALESYQQQGSEAQAACCRESGSLHSGGTAGLLYKCRHPLG